MNKVFLDTSVLLAAGEGIRLYELLADEFPAHQYLTVEGAVRELKNLANDRKGTERAAAKLALQLAEKQDLYIVPQFVNHVDAAILAEAQKSSALIVTLDRALQQRALAAHIPVFTIAKRSLLQQVKTA